MYTLPESGQVSFRMNAEETQQLQAIADKIQQEEKTQFTNSKQIVFALISRVEYLESEILASESRQNELLAEALVNDEKAAASLEIQPFLEKAKEIIGYEGEVSDESVLNDLIDILTTPAVPLPPEIREVTKEVEKELTENQLLLELLPKQMEVLELIARWRYSKRLDEQLKSPEEIVMAMVFNKGAMLNYGDYFRTGLKRKNIK